MTPLLHTRTRPGRCPVEGHGSQPHTGCEVNGWIDLRERYDDHRDADREIADGLADYEEDR